MNFTYENLLSSAFGHEVSHKLFPLLSTRSFKERKATDYMTQN